MEELPDKYEGLAEHVTPWDFNIVLDHIHQLRKEIDELRERLYQVRDLWGADEGQ